MRKPVVFVLGLVCVLLLASTFVLYGKYRKSSDDFAAKTEEEQTTRIRYSQAIGEIATIQDSLNAIVLGQGAGSLLPSRAAETEAPGTLRDQVLSRIETLKAGLERTKEHIQDLDTKLKRDGVRIAGLSRMISGLKKTVAEKEEAIAQLSTQVDSLKTTVAGLNTEVTDQQQQITDKQKELATVFYTMGTKKELTQSGVVTSEGGVLGLGKTLKPSGNFNESSFTPMDTDQETVIRIPAKKAQVLTPQPLSSYVVEPAGTDMMELRILDAKEFCKVKHVVILTT